MRYLAIPLLLPLLAPLAPAQVVIHPNQYGAIEGTGNNSWPFSYSTTAGNYQQAYDASQFPGPMMIDTIAFRHNGDVSRPAGTVDFRMAFAYCAMAYNAVSSVYANNIGSGYAVVFDGQWTMPAFGGDPATPNPFTSRLTLTTPFYYDPAQGDLLMDIQMRASAPGSSGSYDRTASGAGIYRIWDNSGVTTNTSGTIHDYGLITEFSAPPCQGSVVIGGQGCYDSSQTQLAIAYSGCPDLGANLDLSCHTGTTVTAPVILMMGLSDQNWGGIVLPLDLTGFGAPGCSLFISQDLPFGPLANPGGGATLSIAVPNTPWIAGATSYWQGLIIEPGLNPLSIGASNYAAVTVR